MSDISELYDLLLLAEKLLESKRETVLARTVDRARNRINMLEGNLESIQKELEKVRRELEAK